MVAKQFLRLYIIFILHQTATVSLYRVLRQRLYIIFILHQTATSTRMGTCSVRCISSSSYIKPQLSGLSTGSISVVYHLHPTSNRNHAIGADIEDQLYIIFILHQTATYS